MRLRFRDFSIRAKLTTIVLATTGLVLVLASAGLVASQVVATKRDMVRELSSLADAIGTNTVAALTFRDPAAARDTLMALRSQPDVLNAQVLAPNGDVFAAFTSRGQDETPTDRARWQLATIRGARTDGAYEWSQNLTVIRPIRL